MWRGLRRVILALGLCAVCVVWADAASWASPSDNYPTGTGSNCVTYTSGVPTAIAPCMLVSNPTIIQGGHSAVVGPCGLVTAPSSYGWYVYYNDACDGDGGPAIYWQTGMNTTVPTPATTSPSPSPSSSASSSASSSPSPSDSASPSTSALLVTVDGFADFANIVTIALAFLVFFAAAGFVLSWKR